MAKVQQIDLHGIDKAIGEVQNALKEKGRAGTRADRTKVNELVRQLEAIKTVTRCICPRAWVVWPGPEDPPSKPARKSSR